ncbi:MAG TPA: exonuclease SbcCD subunit D, partial [Thermoanaerobaculia bacterium]|nr:exonuclease SbcCD subunit D [Thermoanaerobaculia bacterium]
AGDVFESNRVDGRTLRRGLDAMADVGLPVFLLPGNHDPLDAASVYRSRAFREACPANVRVLADSSPVEVRPGVEVVGAPWASKRPRGDLVAELAAGLTPAPGTLRLAVAHGAVDEGAPDPDDAALIRLETARRALGEGRFHYLALGDRHSATRLEERIHYSGTPEVTDFDEERPGRVLVVELGEGRCEVEEHEVGAWRFVARRVELGGDVEVARLAVELEEIPDKPRTALRLALSGALPLHARAALDDLLAAAGERFAAVLLPGDGPRLIPDALDRDALDLGGYAARAFDRLLAESRGDGEEAAASRQALALFYRLAGGGGG